MEKQESSGIQGIFGLLLIGGGIVLAMIALADLGGFLNSSSSSSSSSSNFIAKNTPGGSFLCSIPGAALVNPACSAQAIVNIAQGYAAPPNGPRTQSLCLSSGGAWINGVCHPVAGAR